jgi:PPOX class probable F420-dependent enzyme
MLSDRERRFLAERRVAHLATADARAVPHVVPVCFALHESTLYITIDAKPKRAPATALKRVQNIAENPAVAVVVDRYDEDWTRLGWVMLRGRAEILHAGTEHDDAQALLRSRYPQLGPMQIAHLPVIAVRVARVTSWGNLDVVIPGLVPGIQPSAGSETSGSMDPGDKRRDDTRG